MDDKTRKLLHSEMHYENLDYGMFDLFKMDLWANALRHYVARRPLSDS